MLFGRSPQIGEDTLPPFSIDCGYLVRSLTFASFEDVADKQSVFWLRIAKCKSLFLITGHNTGRIRVWDADSGKCTKFFS